MPEEVGGSSTTSRGAGLAGSEDIMDLLPLELVRSQVIPPAPNRRESSIDWLPEFGGASWIAYGASSLLVISHFPSPFSCNEPQPGPFFRQVIEPPTGNRNAELTAVSWCPVQPSEGEIAVALENNIFMYSPVTSSAPGSFSWRQTVVIVETFPIEIIGWTGSGDGLVAAGTEVVLWIRKSNLWEMAWKVRTEVPQTHVSASWFSDGLVATAARGLVHHYEVTAKESNYTLSQSAKHVTVYFRDGKSGTTTVQLYHPQPIVMIQWRPYIGVQSQADPSSVYNILLTGCLDGTVRLWSEIDNGRPRKFNKEIHDQKSMKRLFHVVAVIEMNQSLKGILGTNIFVKWAIDSSCVIFKGESGGYSLLPTYTEHQQIGKCDWLIGIGPDFSVTFWAVHCLYDVSPPRFPRVTMWKKGNLMDFKDSKYPYFGSPNIKNQAILVKVVASRSWLCGPPIACSLLQLLPDNSFSWSELYSPSEKMEDTSLRQIDKERSLSYIAHTALSELGHTGCIIQVAVHPCSFDILLAVSLDSNALLLFWSLSTLSESILPSHTYIHPMWKLLDHVSLKALSPDHEYSCLVWGPAVLNENQFLLVGHEDGIDCFMIEVSCKEESISAHKVLTVPFNGYNDRGNPPDQIFAIPLISNPRHSSNSSSFLLVSVWRENYNPLSWTIDLHMSINDGVSSNDNDLAISKGQCVSSSGKCCYATFYKHSFESSPHCWDGVTTISVASPTSCPLPFEQVYSNDSPSNYCGYHMATGYSGGTVKLWRICHMQQDHSDSENVPWELAGTFTAHEGPVNFLSLSSCSSKVATASIDGRNSTTSLHIWEFVKLTHGGSFVLEDAIDLNGILIAVRWLALGNGQMLLGICLPNEFRVYSQRRSSTHSFAYSDMSKEMHTWYCIAVSGSSTIVRDFLWGPKLTAVIVHEKHFSICSQWLLRTNNTYNVENSVAYVGRIEESLLCVTNTGKNMFDTDEQLEYGYSKKISLQDNVPNTENKLFYILDVSQKLGGSLALYDPEALIQYIYSGNWKYALVILKNFVECICSYKTSTTIPESNKQSLLSCKMLEVHLARYIEDNNSKNSSSEKLFWGQNITTSGPNFHLGGNELQFPNTHLETNTFERIPDNSNKSEITELIDTLEKSNQVSSLTDLMKTQILVILELLNEISNTKATAAYGSLDDAGRRFWVSVRFQYLYSMRRSGGVVAEDLPVNSRLAAWAFQSDCQDDLLNSVLSSDPSWVDMRNLGVGLWYTNASQLRTRMEKLARSEYLRNKNPKDCALWYLALNRLQVLISLFKISKDEKDKVLFGFLSRNFQDEKNKAAALKNAYVLMGKHELKLAIAFFLLGGDSSSAVSVCAKNLGDDQLALVICRLLEGYGGSLEKQLISNILLPKALEKGDYWLSSLLEWTLGNYSQSVKTLVNGQTKQVNRNSAALCNYGALSDPDIGRYCVILASRNTFRCSVGEDVAADLSKFASFLAASALNRCGVPLEALSCLSYSLSSDGKDQKNVSTAGPHDIFHQILSPFTGDGCNWVLDNVSHQLEVNTKTNIALYYIDSFLRNHRVWSSHSLSKSREVISCHYVYLQEEDLSQMKQDLQMLLSMIERKFLLKSVDIFNLVLLSAHNYGSLFLGYLMLHVEEFTRNEYKNWSADLIFVPAFVRLLIKSTVEILCFLARFVVSFNFTESMLKPLHDNHYQIHTILFCLKNMLCFIRTFGSSSNYYQGEKASEDFSTFFPFALDLLEFYVDFAFACIEGNFKGLFMMINHILIALANDESSIEVLSDELRKFLCQNSQLVTHCASVVEVESISNSNFKQKHLETGDFPIADDEKWKLLWISLWLHMLNFAKHGLGKISIKEGSHNGSSINNIITVFISAITKSLVSTVAYISSSLVKLVASFLRQKALKGLPIPSILWLDEIARSHPTSLHYHLNQRLDSLQLSDNKTQVSLKMLWDISICPVDICEHFAKEKVTCFPYYHGNQFDTWKDVQRNIFSDNENDHINDKQEKLDSGSSYKETISEHGGNTMDNNGFVETGRKHSGPRTDISYFHNPREITRRSGELFEAICFNSINEHEIAIASNKKGLIFFNLKYEEYSRKQADYIWSDCDWPKDGWAGCESTPVPTYISQGIGLGSKRGVHLGLGGATIGMGSLARPRRDLTGGGAFGIPGYAGIGAAGLGWGEEEFEEFRDPPATVENIHSRALARHPLLPFLLVGSSNTHVYLWEFGKQSATATYGVLPAANVPPPYALASISALQFDHYGHRFATAALDGTICTWQLEVGGRSNVHPTDSSLCFDNHASDVAYVATSGSILAVAGSSTNGINVVLWDTLAPPATSQASLFCHEGGARSISVFDHVIGTGSISPIIVTGGRSGDVGLHDLRYIATGKTRRNRHASEQDLKTMHATNSGISKYAENSNGMMWYIPKAHLASVTRIATIPNTSLFLTGSKDGDVKLWDAKRSQLVFQWQKLHERHTFLQPNSRGFGGVVRAAVTDIQVLSRGFLTCGGDGSTKLIQLK
ncbi:uncharacterized protein LOC121970563 isoform X1 [Zingiber officinale]|uniref:uncharacterized protein LOC121970563 isoform X1 n=1 Tax=Zingiber officinale TaxID=94328 RepID=UPI001C4B5DC3|nr:uncharacterized protein LOC121970563 isoform X1 [Zingiber officinale]